MIAKDSRSSIPKEETLNKIKSTYNFEKQKINLNEGASSKLNRIKSPILQKLSLANWEKDKIFKLSRPVKNTINKDTKMNIGSEQIVRSPKEVSLPNLHLLIHFLTKFLLFYF
jgi:hypothetical protein